MSAYMPGEPCTVSYRVIWYRVPDCCIGGPYAVVVRNADNRNVSSCSGIRTREDAMNRAWQYAQSFKTSYIQEAQA